MAFTYTWSESSPAGSDPVSGLDTQIQNLKKAIRERVATRGATGTITPESDWTVGVIHWNTTVNEINYSLSASTWARVGINFDDGTVAVFYQAAAPIGWTLKSTGFTNSGVLIAQTSAGGTTGGSVDPYSGTVTISSSGSHTHTATTAGGSAHTHSIAGDAVSLVRGIVTGAVADMPIATHVHTLGNESSHTHTLTTAATAHTHTSDALNLAYNVVRLCTKNAVNT